jgi:Ca2+-binding RTX toxin-like protein
MLDVPSPGSDMQADRADIVGDRPAPAAQVAAIEANPPSFASAATAAGLDADLLAVDLAQLMLVPVWLEPAAGAQAALPPPTSIEPSSGDPHLLLTMLTRVSLFELMDLSVESGTDLRQDLAVTTLTDDAAAAFLQSLLSLSLSELMSVGARDDLVLTDYADKLAPPDPFWSFDPIRPAGSLTSEGPPPSDHVAAPPSVGVDSFTPPPPPALFTAGDDTIVFDAIAAGAVAGNAHDALAGDDNVVLPSTAVEAAQAGYDTSQGFSGGAGNDTIVAGGLADAIDGGDGTDTVSYAGSGGVIVLLQNTDTHGPHANEPAGGTGGLAEGDSYAGIEVVIASEVADYVFGGADGTTAYLLGGDDEYDNTETQMVADYVDGGAGNDSIWGGDGADMLIGGDGADHLHGERGADTLDGGSGTDAVNGQDGNDLLDGGTGLDSLSGGNGDDVLIWRGADAQLAGGAGTDTLRLASGDLALGGLAGIASGIERIDMAADSASNTLTLIAADIVSLSDSDTLTIDGDAGDSVDAGTGWTDGGIDGAGNHVFTKLVGAALATLAINEDVTVNPDITV